MFRRRRRRDAGAPAPTTRPLPASLAAANGWLAYSTFIGDNDRIHLIRPDGSQDHQAFTELPGEAIRADFSHDGQLAFEHRPPDGATNVYVAKADGSGARVIAKCAWGTCERGFPAWSPDSKSLATTVDLGKPDLARDRPPPVFAIGIIDVATQQVRYILKHPSRQWQPQLPRWSPDGRKLVFYGWRASKDRPFEESPDAEAAVFTVNLDGSGLKQLTPWTLRCGDPDWSPDGSTIICTTHPAGDFDIGQGEIYAMRPDGSELHALTKNGPNGPRAGHARFTPDGKAILYVRAATQDWQAPPRQIYALDLATGQEMPVLTKRDIYTRPCCNHRLHRGGPRRAPAHPMELFLADRDSGRHPAMEERCTDVSHAVRAFTLLAAVALALAASACSGSGVDKAGGTRTEQPVVLTLANHEQGPEDVQFWIEEVQRRSGGSLRIQVQNQWRDQELAYDKATIADVQAGKVQLAKVAARAYDTVGLDSFQALLAPFLIDDQTLERRVLESELAGRMLAGTGRLGLVGLAVLPTDLRKPLGLSRPLVAVKDYRGARIGVREGELAKATFAALGATPVGYVPGGPLSGLDGVELGLGTIRGNEYDQQATAVTANVTFWPRTVTVVMNRRAFDSLTPSQRDALQQAGSSVVARQLAFRQGEEGRDRELLCRRGLRFVRASDQELAALRRAVQPVYRQLERNAVTRSLLQQIQMMKHQTPATAAPHAPTCSPSDAAAAPGDRKATVLDGVYRTSFTREELANSPLLYDDGEVQAGNWGEFTLTFDHGRVTLDQRGDIASESTSGGYTVNGKAITLHFTEGVNAGETFTAHWSLYRDVLTFKRLGELPTSYLVKPWRRIR